MNNFVRIRYIATAGFLSAAACTIVLLQVPSPSGAAIAPVGNRAGAYVIPDLPGWTKTVEADPARAYPITSRGKKQTVWSPAVKTITFSKTTQGSVAQVEFSVFTFRETITYKQMLQAIKAAEWGMTNVTPSSGSGIKSGVVWSKETHIDGNEAYMRSKRYGYGKYGKEKIPVEETSLTFCREKSMYTLSRRLRGASVPPGLRQKTQQAGAHLSRAIRDQ